MKLRDAASTTRAHGFPRYHVTRTIALSKLSWRCRNLRLQKDHQPRVQERSDGSSSSAPTGSLYFLLAISVFKITLLLAGISDVAAVRSSQLLVPQIPWRGIRRSHRIYSAPPHRDQRHALRAAGRREETHIYTPTTSLTPIGVPHLIGASSRAQWTAATLPRW